MTRRAQLETARVGEIDQLLRLSQRLRSDRHHVAAARLGDDLRTFARGVERGNRRCAEGEAERVVAKMHWRRFERERRRMRHPSGEARLELRPQRGIDVEKRSAWS